MSSQHVSLPSKPRIVSEKEFSGAYEIDGLYPGYGQTLGNSLRRIILSSIPGAAITQVKIAGVAHEFSTIEGVKEDVVTILLNLRRIRMKLTTDEPQTLTLSVKGPKEVTAADLHVPGQVEVLNPEQHIASISGKADLDMEITVERGLGYIPREVLQKDRVEVGSIALDAAFSPIRRVNYEVENMRVGDRTDFNRLRIFIETDGSLMPREALERSIEIMIHQLTAIIGFKAMEEEEPEDSEEIQAVQAARVAAKSAAASDAEAMKIRIEELNLTPRVQASLEAASIRTVGGIARKREEDLLLIPGLGQKGIQEIKRALSNYGVTLRS